MTLNQKYRQSGTNKSFKDWVFEQQTLGNLDLSIYGVEKPLETANKNSKPKYLQPIIIGIALISVIYFITRKASK